MSETAVVTKSRATAEKIRLSKCLICDGEQLFRANRELFDFSPRRELYTQLCLNYDGLSFWLMKCRKCKFIQPEWLPPEAYFDDLYNLPPSDEYYSQVFEMQYRDHIYSYLLKKSGRLVSGKRLLDIGSNVGRFIDVANKSGWNSEGIELSQGMADFCRKKTGLKVYPDLSEVVSRGETYDVVTVLDVLEHIPWPLSFLRKVVPVIREGGVLLVKVPSGASQILKERLRSWFGGTGRIALNMIHVNHFSPQSLAETFSKVGMQFEHVEVAQPEVPDTWKKNLLYKSVYSLTHFIPMASYSPFAFNLLAVGRARDNT